MNTTSSSYRVRPHPTRIRTRTEDLLIASVPSVESQEETVVAPCAEAKCSRISLLRTSIVVTGIHGTSVLSCYRGATKLGYSGQDVALAGAGDRAGR